MPSRGNVFRDIVTDLPTAIRRTAFDVCIAIGQWTNWPMLTSPPRRGGPPRPPAQADVKCYIRCSWFQPKFVIFKTGLRLV
jgi:hypothetical protein